MAKYDSYKDSGVKWIGEIPEHWNIVRIKNIVQIKICDGPHETPNWVDEGIPFISAEAIRGNKIDLKFKRGNITIEQHKEYTKKSKVQRGDILFCKSGSTTGKSAIVEINEDFGIWSPLALIRADSEKVDNYYLFHSIQSDIFKKQVETAWTFGTQPNIGMGALENLWIVLPNSLSDQKIISNYLDQKITEIDKLISKKGQLIKLLEEEKTAVINQAITKGLDSGVRMKNSGVEWLGEIPEHWNVKQIKYVGKIINGYSFKSEDFVEKSGCRVLKIANIQNTRIDWTDDSYLPELFYTAYENFQIMEGDLVFALTRPIISSGIKASIVDSNEKILLNQRNSVLKPSKDLRVKWIYFLILNHFFKQQFEKLIDSTGQQPNISSNDIGNIKIPFPLLKEQEKIITYLEREMKNIDCLVEKIQNEIILLREYRTALISEVVTGKVDIREELLVN